MIPRTGIKLYIQGRQNVGLQLWLSSPKVFLSIFKMSFCSLFKSREGRSKLLLTECLFNSIKLYTEVEPYFGVCLEYVTECEQSHSKFFP